jgi:hypothetical protein
MVACIDFFEMSEICRPKFIVRHSMYSHDHGISSVVVIQLTLAVKQALHISNPTLEFLT